MLPAFQTTLNQWQNKIQNQKKVILNFFTTEKLIWELKATRIGRKLGIVKFKELKSIDDLKNW